MRVYGMHLVHVCWRCPLHVRTILGSFDFFLHTNNIEFVPGARRLGVPFRGGPVVGA
jgi:hypothetical protein